MAKLTLKETKKITVNLELTLTEAAWLRGILGGICSLPKDAENIWQELHDGHIPLIENVYVTNPKIRDKALLEVNKEVTNWEYKGV